MEPNQLDNIVRDVYIRTRQIWQSNRASLTADNDHGFKILYSPVRLEPSVLIIGAQPGGDSSHIRASELTGPSPFNEYLSQSWPLAAELRRRFSIAFLRESVGTNVIFFRAPSLKLWRKVEKTLRLNLESFCIDEKMRLIRAMRPKKILLLGWDALKLLRTSQFQELVANQDPRTRSGRKRLLEYGKIEEVPAFAIPHPSAAWKNPPVTDAQWEAIATKVMAGGG